MSATLTVTKKQANKIARPLKVLIPLIQTDLEHGDRAGMEYYANAGAKLLEAKSQLSHGSWGAWLSKNFHLRADTARQYMRLAQLRDDRDQNNGRAAKMPSSLREMSGHTARARERRAVAAPFRETLDKVDQDLFAREKQTRDEEVRLHRELAEELINLGYKALAMRLHPDRRGGSRDAMVRLNRVRDELQGIAETRRFV
jgi:hypothetical protein